MTARVQILSRNNRLKYLKKFVWYAHPGFRCYPDVKWGGAPKVYGKVVRVKTTKPKSILKKKKKKKKKRSVRFS